MKKILSNIIFCIIISICSYLIIANAFHILYLRKYEKFDFESQAMDVLRDNISSLETNITELSKVDTTVFIKEDLEFIVDNVNTTFENIKSNKLLTYKGTKKIYLKDLLQIDLGSNLQVVGNIKMLEILAKYDNSISNYIDVYKADYLNNIFSNEFAFQESIQAYKYHTVDTFSQNVLEVNNLRISARIYILNNYVVKANYLTQLAIKIGGNNHEKNH